jgi:hypothetical protein
LKLRGPRRQKESMSQDLLFLDDPKISRQIFCPGKSSPVISTQNKLAPAFEVEEETTLADQSAPNILLFHGLDEYMGQIKRFVDKV